MEISSWKLPSPKREYSNDYRPGIHHRRDEDDDDDDNDDDSQNNRPKSHQTPTAWFSEQPFSRQADNSYPAEEWLGWIEGGIYDAQAGPTSTEKVEAYLKHQSQVESEADDGPLSDTKSKNSRGSEDFVGRSRSPQKTAIMEIHNLEFAIEDILDMYHHWITKLYVEDKKRELKIVGFLHDRCPRVMYESHCPSSCCY
jgi:hypothetical protein